ncbi:hypothetical protein V5O48_018835 [Marasmius crinis-equi]|uniref:Uncharacterized protein n=1 Tax=Marasmius crinis-equi TaxID=585013 RepID=A0ABR3EK23_9AGAR
MGRARAQKVQVNKNPLRKRTPVQHRTRRETRSPRVFVPSLLLEHRKFIKTLIFTDFYEFLHNDMIPAGLNWIFFKIQSKFPEFALYPSGSTNEVEEICRVRKEDLRMLIYKGLHDVYTYNDGQWMAGTPIDILKLSQLISLDNYMAAGTHSMRWWYNHAPAQFEWFGKEDSEDAIMIQVETLNDFYHDKRVKKIGKQRRYYIRTWYLNTLSIHYDLEHIV